MIAVDEWSPREKRNVRHNGGRASLLGAALTALLLALGLGRARPAERDDPMTAAMNEPGRGRQAESPHEIPARGWKDVFLRIYEKISEDRLLAIAAGVTFYGLLAIFPALAALVSIYGLFADPTVITRHLEALAGVLPGGAVDVIGGQLQRISGSGRGALGLTFLISLLVSLWSANAGTRALFDALNVVYGEREKRSFIRLNIVSLLFTIGVILFLVIVLAAAVVMPAVADFLGLPREMQTVISLLPWPILLIAAGVLIALVYRFGPSRTKPQMQWVSVGSVFATLGWLAASALFSWYAANFGTFNETYGSLGAVIGFMIWIWISTIVILVGAELNAEAEHQTARDSTIGMPKPLGTRGAHVADTIGPAQS